MTAEVVRLPVADLDTWRAERPYLALARELRLRVPGSRLDPESGELALPCPLCGGTASVLAAAVAGGDAVRCSGACDEQRVELALRHLAGALPRACDDPDRRRAAHRSGCPRCLAWDGAARDAYREARRVGGDRESAVAEAVERLRVRDEAARAYRAETAPPEPFDAGTLAEVLAREPEPEARVGGLLPWSAGLLVIAQRKTGKTTYGLNIARSLVTGADFLGVLPVRPIAPEARVGFLNFEVSGATLARWADESGVPADRLYVVNLRGRRNPFASADDLDRLGELLREARVESLIVDPFGKAFDGESQNDNTAVGAWLDRLDAWARGTVGALDVILTAHAGHQGEHVRGASALEGWADVNVYLTRQGPTRYLSAEGRDVELPESALAFDAATRALTLAGGSRIDGKLDTALSAVVALLRDAGLPMSGRAIEDAMEGVVSRDDVRAALKYGDRSSRLTWEYGPKRARLWSAAVLPEAVSSED